MKNHLIHPPHINHQSNTRKKRETKILTQKANINVTYSSIHQSGCGFIQVTGGDSDPPHLDRLEVEVAEVEDMGGESEVVSSSGGASW